MRVAHRQEGREPLLQVVAVLLRRLLQPVVIRGQVELADAAGNVGALPDAHQPLVLAQLLPDLARGLEQSRGGLVDLPQHVVERFLRHLGIVAQRLERVLLALQLLQQVGFEVGAPRHLEDLEDRKQRDVVLVRVVLVQEIVDALEQILEPQQRAHALAQWILVADHVGVAGHSRGWRLRLKYSPKPEKNKGFIADFARAQRTARHALRASAR